MKREDAFYHKLLLMAGLDDGYDEWLNFYLESENPISNIALELYMCGYDVDKTIFVLHSFCTEQSIYEAAICNRIRLFYKNAYYSGKMSKEEITLSMYQLVSNIGYPSDPDFNECIWGDMYYLDYYYGLAKDGLIPMENFDFAFFSYLDNGISIDYTRIWNQNKRGKISLFHKIKEIINR